MKPISFVPTTLEEICNVIIMCSSRISALFVAISGLCFSHFSPVFSQQNQVSSSPAVDINGDGIVSVADVLELLGAFGSECE
jgi:hypothetical protein